MEFLKIDGSYGEGGGQILRSALALGCVTKKPILIENIRKNRKSPGLRPAHLAAVRLLARTCDAKVEGAYVGSTALKFTPRESINTKLQEDIGTAGSISLVLQALIPAVSLAGSKLELTIRGGTDVPWSPTANYTKHVLREAYSRIGINYTMDVKKRGYYPRGGGIVELTVEPAKKTRPIFLTQRLEKNAEILCTFSKLPQKQISNSVKLAEEILRKNGFCAQSKIVEEGAIDRGASILVYNYDSKSIVGTDELYSVDFGKKVAENFVAALGVDTNLADMLVTPLSVTEGLSIFTVRNISKHLQTNLYVTSKITGARYGVGKIEGGFEIRIEGLQAGIK